MALGFNAISLPSCPQLLLCPSLSLLPPFRKGGAGGEGELGPPALLEDGLVCVRKVPPRDQCHLSPSSAGDT